jgi:cytoskeletal protein CcmA (bactofilin family)
MFGKSKDENDREPHPVQQLQRPAAMHSGEQVSTDQASSISRGMTVVGKISGEGTVQVFGHIEGELRALTVLINEGAKVEGDVVAEELTIGGQVKGTIHANRVKLNSTAVVEGEIFHRSLSIEENARFEGSSKRVRTMLSMCRAPHLGARRPRMISRQRLPPSRAIGNPMGHQPLTATRTRQLKCCPKAPERKIPRSIYEEARDPRPTSLRLMNPSRFRINTH